MRIAPVLRLAVFTSAALAILPDSVRAQGLGDVRQDQAEETRIVRRRPPLTAAAARTWLMLSRPIPLPFEQGAPLEEVLKFIKHATVGPKEAGLPIFVDPVALRKSNATMSSKVTINLEGIPLATSLGLILKQHNLRYGVQQDGLLVIGNTATIPLSQARTISEAQANAWIALARRVAVPFEQPVSLEVVVKFLKEASRSEDLPDGLPIYVDPISLAEHDLTLDKAAVTLDLREASLLSALHLMLAQMDLIFRVDPDGVVVIEHKDSRDDASEAAPDLDAIEALRQEVTRLRREVVYLKARLGIFRPGGKAGPR